MIFGEFLCNSCGEIFEATKAHLENFSEMHPECPKCHGVDTRYKFKPVVFDVAEGKFGNSKNGYENGFVNHTSVYGKPKGVKIKKRK